MTLKVRNQDFSIATCQTYVDLPKKFFNGKVLFFTQLSYHLMRKLLKKPWMVSSVHTIWFRDFGVFVNLNRKTGKSNIKIKNPRKKDQNREWGVYKIKNIETHYKYMCCLYPFIHILFIFHPDLYWFYPFDKKLIVTRFYLRFLQKSTLSKFYPHFILILSR